VNLSAKIIHYNSFLNNLQV